MEMKALLLNPPGDQKFLRDYFCSTISKTGYYWHPIDLLIQSGFLSKHFDIKVLDAIAEGINPERALHIVSEFKPDIILSMTGVLSYEQDMAFLSSIKNTLPFTNIFVIGEPLLEYPEELMKTHDFINGGMFSFSYDDITAHTEERYNDIKAMIFRKGNEIITKPMAVGKGPLKFPIPRHELFPLSKYWMPFIMHHPFASVLTTYGCPYTCAYCNSGANTLGLMIRDIDDVINEIKYVKSLGMKHIFIKDMTFGMPRKHVVNLCKEIIKQELDITWHCYSRADVVDDEMLRLMKMAGCNLIQFGVETSSEATLKKYNKSIPLDKTIQAFELAHKHGILTGAHFIFGLPGDSLDDMKKTVKLAKSLKPAYVSFNIATPRYGTPLKQIMGMDDAMPNNRIKRFVGRAYVSFYFRPAYAVQLLTSIRTFTQLRSILREGVGLLQTIL